MPDRSHAGFIPRHRPGVIHGHPEQIDPLKHPVLPYSQQPDLLEEQLLFIRRDSCSQLPLFRFQAIKKESLKLPCGNCVFIPLRCPVSHGILVSRLAAFFTFGAFRILSERSVQFLFPTVF